MAPTSKSPGLILPKQIRSTDRGNVESAVTRTAVKLDTPRRVCGWTLGRRDTQTARRFVEKLPKAPHILYCSDYYYPYTV